MPLERISSAQAMTRLHDRARDQIWPDGRTPDGRLSAVADVKTTGAFNFNHSDKIFTAGSCFARNIERRLREAGFTTPMYDDLLHERLAEHGLVGSFMNKYNMAAIRQEIAWAFGESAVSPEAGIVSVGDGLLHDLLLSPGNKRLDETTVWAVREDVQSRYRRLPECRVIVLTMGLAEVWRDLDTGLALNHAPPASVLKAMPDRYVLDVLSYEEMLADLNGIHALATKHGHPDVKLVLTVSPVPLHVTFREQDVMVANSYSKSMQRAAAEAFSLAHDNVAYFPSYEIVTLTDRRLSYESDNRHVQASVVDHIVDRFIGLYVIENSPRLAPTEIVPSTVADLSHPRHVLRTAQYLEEEGDRLGAAALYRRLIEAFPNRFEYGDSALDQPDTTIQTRVARLLIEAGDLPAAISAIDQLVTMANGDASVMLRALDLYYKARSAERMFALLESDDVKRLALSPDDVDVRLASAHLLAKNFDQAEPLFTRLSSSPTLSPAHRDRVDKGAAQVARIRQRQA